VDEIFARAGGNAFFTEQLVAASAGGDGPLRLKIALPRGLAQLLVAQADTVGDDSRRLLEALAIAGRELDEALLASITDLAGARLAAAVRELTSARLIDPAGTDGRYRLRHALVGEAVAAVMLVGERRERHAVVARALSTSAGAERSAEVAEHWAAADDAGEEMPWRQMAAREAERVYAHREAATHWQRLIELWPLAPKDVRPSGLGLVGAYLNAVAALDRCGDTRAAGELAERALRTLAATADPLTRAVVYERVAGHRALDEDGAALAPLETAMELLADLPLGREHAAVLRAYADALWWVNRYDEARRYLDRALQASRSVGATADEVEALCDLPYYAFDAGDIETGMSCLDQAAAICGRDGNQLGAIEVTAVRSEALLALGRLPESIAEAWAGLEAARRVGLEQHAYAQLLRSNVFEALAELGRPADGEDLIRRATESTPTSGASFDHMTRAIVDMLAGDLVAATDRWAAVDAVTHPKNLTYGGNLVDRGALDLWAQRPRDALSRIQGVPQPLDAAQYRRFTAAILTTGVRACADLAEDARARHDVVGEAEARKAAQDLASAHDAMARDPFALHPYWTTGGAEGASWAAELTRLAGMSDPDAWADAAAAWATLGRPHRTAYARWRQAQAFIAAGRTAYAGDCLREAATEAQSHAPLLAEIGKVARVVHVDLDHEQPRADRTVPAPGKLYELTPRELEVLRLVADGLTNTQIGVRLFIGKSTASVHVTNILRKLGAKNRAEAAAIAHRAGLLPPDPP
jgi:DNA-binding NarL/FixJ family response regulator